MPREVTIRNDVAGLADWMRRQDDIGVVCHVSPDGDTLGSALALAECLRNMGKNACVLCQDEVPHMYHFMPGALDICSPESAPFMIRALLFSDVSDQLRAGSCLLPEIGPRALIDHHPTNPAFCDVNYVDGGAATDTQDAQGTLIGEVHEPATADALRAVLGQFTGDIMQAPSAYSALKQDGRKLCDIARAGGEVHTQPRPVSIYELEYLRQTAPDGHLMRVKCSKGTYIRALCDDIGRALGCGAHMRFLLRTLSAGFGLAGAHTLEELDAGVERCIEPIDAPIAHLPAVYAPESLYPRVRCGNRLPAGELRGDVDMAGPLRLYAARAGRDEFAGIVERDGDELKFRAMLLSAEG